MIKFLCRLTQEAISVSVITEIINKIQIGVLEGPKAVLLTWPFYWLFIRRNSRPYAYRAEIMLEINVSVTYTQCETLSSNTVCIGCYISYHWKRARISILSCPADQIGNCFYLQQSHYEHRMAFSITLEM